VRYLNHFYAFYFIGHIPHKQKDYRRRFRHLAATYVTFSPDGRDLLVNIGGEQIYLYNMASSTPPQTINLPQMVDPALSVKKGVGSGE